MSAATAAERGRRLAESLMTSACTIRAGSAGFTTDPETGAVVDAPGAVVYSGKCRIRPETLQASSTAQAGGAEVFRFGYLVSVPFAESDPVEGMLCTVDASPDAALVGRELQVVKVERGDEITARRLYCEEVA